MTTADTRGREEGRLCVLLIFGLEKGILSAAQASLVLAIAQTAHKIKIFLHLLS